MGKMNWNIHLKYTCCNVNSMCKCSKTKISCVVEILRQIGKCRKDKYKIYMYRVFKIRL